jgi:hypothetical protein
MSKQQTAHFGSQGILGVNYNMLSIKFYKDLKFWRINAF